MGAHEGDGVHEEAELLGRDGERAEVERADGGVRTEEVMAAQGAPGDVGLLGARVAHFFFFAFLFLFCFLFLAACLFCSAFKRSLASAS